MQNSTAQGDGRKMGRLMAWQWGLLEAQSNLPKGGLPAWEIKPRLGQLCFTWWAIAPSYCRPNRSCNGGTLRAFFKNSDDSSGFSRSASASLISCKRCQSVCPAVGLSFALIPLKRDRHLRPNRPDPYIFSQTQFIT